jgi:mono/diheme cytochrome c family protein
MKHVTLVTVVVTACILILSGAAAARDHAHAPIGPRSVAALDTTPQVTQAMIDAGRKIFHGPGTCFACHGQKLEGTAIAPNLKDEKWLVAGGTYAGILKVVQGGVPGTAMPSHPGGISDELTREVAAYVWAVSHGKAKL